MLFELDLLGTRNLTGGDSIIVCCERVSTANATSLSDESPFTKQRRLYIELIEGCHVAISIDPIKQFSGHWRVSLSCCEQY